MATLLRRSVVPTLLIVCSGLHVARASMQTQSVEPEQAAYTAAVAIKEPDAKLAALDKIRSEFPHASNLAAVDAQIMSTLLANFPDRVDAVTEAFERIIARISPATSAEMRLAQTLSPVSQVVAKHLLLDRSEQLVQDALAAMSFEKYVETQRDLARRTNRPEPPESQLEGGFNSARARAHEQLARIDMAQAEDNLKASIKLNPAYGTAQSSLADMYVGKGDIASAEALYADAVKNSTTPAAAARASMALADFYAKHGDAAKAEQLLNEIVQSSPTLGSALLALARLEEKRGDAAHAIDHYLTAACAGALPAADNVAVHNLYRKTHAGSEEGFEAELDRIYRERFPNPIKPDVYIPAAKSARVVLLEMFTGSGCGPCVSADLAMDAIIARYPPGAIVPIAYHENIPQPDPMVVAAGEGRREYYKVRGVPTFNIDGALAQLGGGARTSAPSVYQNYVGKIDRELAVPADAAITLTASGDGDLVNVTANVSKIASKSKDLRLHMLLVERELRFMGENGVRFHPMVVRAQAGDRGAGIPIKGNGTTRYTFNLATIREDLIRTLTAEIEKRRSTEPPGMPRTYAADGHPSTAIDTSGLSVVAFLQDGDYVAPLPAEPTTTDPSEGAPTSPPIVNTKATGRAAVAPPPPFRTANLAGLSANVLQAAKVDVVFTSAKSRRP